MNKIIAVTGMCGSGKSEAVKFFVEKGFKQVYFGEVVLNEMKRLGLEINEKNEKETRENLRKELGMGAMAVKSMTVIEEFVKHNSVVVESLYSWDEFKILKEKFGDAFKLLTIYTTKALRYERLAKRSARPLSYEESISRDVSEIENLDKGGPIAFTDYLVINDGTLEELKKSLDKYL
ncbi:MAG: AAA family ATPase [Chlorobi bacterium]|nr:AAA family ATPase [Chlorobiota bacterium]MCI0715662.1 AAA family ATPase [Chlorobiota bacterium]